MGKISCSKCGSTIFESNDCITITNSTGNGVQNDIKLSNETESDLLRINDDDKNILIQED